MGIQKVVDENMNVYKRGSLFTILLFLMGVSVGFNQVSSVNDVVDEITASIRNRNVKDLSQHLSSTVSMNILNEEGVYSKVQAEIVLKDFFEKNQPEEVKTLQKLQSKSTYRFVVLEMQSSKGTFRISYKLLGVEQSYKISEFRIENYKSAD